MSLDNHDIYNEMEQQRYSKKSNGFSIISKIVACVLFLSIGFAVGNIYKVSNDTNSTKTATGIIQTVSTTPATIVNKGDQLSIKEIAALTQDSIVEKSMLITPLAIFHLF